MKRVPKMAKYGLPLGLVLCLGLGLGMGWETSWTSVKHHQASNAPLQNYGVIWPNKLTRSGMPASDQGWYWLRNQGVKSVVTFRPEHDVNYDQFGFHVMRLPMEKDPPDEQQAEEFLRFIQSPKNQPVHIHCTAGEGRTGLMAALTRYAIDGWPLDQALAEARSYRDGRDLSKNRLDWLKKWAAKHPPGSARLSH
jgi:protein tyrosine/serine phosphatase